MLDCVLLYIYILVFCLYQGLSEMFSYECTASIAIKYEKYVRTRQKDENTFIFFRFDGSVGLRRYVVVVRWKETSTCVDLV
jgi:hypothetical protein